ncbi:VOC family protein [Haloplanus salilacus]|uniref:VOC family protein n=1 Tax=Haloplanus salilacus TaxID=2949994 RepID=UPI0030D460B0
MDVLHTAIEVSDLDATRAFYEELLGLERSREYEKDGVQNYYVTGSGPGELQFRVVESVPDPTGIEHIAIAADDVDDAVAEAVETFGVTVEEEPRTLERVNRRLAALTDPDGYTVHLIEEV